MNSDSLSEIKKGWGGQHSKRKKEYVGLTAKVGLDQLSRICTEKPDPSQNSKPFKGSLTQQ